MTFKVGFFINLLPGIHSTLRQQYLSCISKKFNLKTADCVSAAFLDGAKFIKKKSLKCNLKTADGVLNEIYL